MEIGCGTEPFVKDLLCLTALLHLENGLVDKIDEVLGRHFHMTPDESDFVVNFDIKYRVGADSEDDE